MNNKFLAASFIIIVMVWLGVNLVAVISFTVATTSIVWDYWVSYRANELNGFRSYVILFSFPFWLFGVLKGFVQSIKQLRKKRTEAKAKLNQAEKED